MSERTPLHNEMELKIMEMSRDARHYSYDLVQKLTFFVISIELVFCGYILLNSEKLGAVHYSSLLFLLAGIGAIFGLLWRFFYNQTFHDGAHDKVTPLTINLYRLQNISHWLFVLATTVFLIFAVYVGYKHLRKIESATNPTSHAKISAEKKETTLKPEKAK